MRSDNRAPDTLRETTITPDYIAHAEGSVLIEAGRTRVICTASIEDRVPPFLRNSGKGWVTAEYGMLPRATSTRKPSRLSPTTSASTKDSSSSTTNTTGSLISSCTQRRGLVR